MTAVLGHIAKIGLDATKDRLKGKYDENAARAKLVDYIQRQREYNFDCRREEEIDFEGLAEYIQRDLIEDVKIRLFGNPRERGIARQTISDKAAYYAKARTKLSENRARHLACIAVDILASFYRSKVGRELLLVAAEIEDAVISSITDQCHSLEQQVDKVSQKVDNAVLLSVDRALLLAREGHIDEVEKNFSTAIKSLNAEHVLAPYYGFGMDGQDRLKSVPLLHDAIKNYPPHLNVQAKEIKVGNTYIQRLDAGVFDYSYRHQQPIEFNVADAKKYLGDIPDPIQHEAEDFSKSHIIMKPPAFPAAFPCSVSVDGNVEVDYLLLRTKEIKDDGTIIFTNDEQNNFNFRVEISVNLKLNSVGLKITPISPTNRESLKYRLFLKHAASGNSIELKALELNAIIISTKRNLILNNCDRLDSEIEFLKKIVAIEEYFQIHLLIPDEITPEDHRIIDRLYEMINNGKYCGKCGRFTLSFEVSEELRKSISNLGDKACGLAFTSNVHLVLFGQELNFLILRKIDCVRLENYEKVKAKIEVLDDGDVLKLGFMNGETGSDCCFTDIFYSKEAESQLLHPAEPDK